MINPHDDATWAALPYRWPADTETPRRIRIEILTWQGLSLGAKHWMAKVRVEGNQKVYLDENGARRYWSRIGKDSTLEDMGVEHEAKFMTVELAAKWARYAASKLLAEFPGAVAEWDDPEYADLDTEEPLPAMYWIGKHYGFMWWDERENDDYSPSMAGHLRRQGFYDWPAWNHPERRC